MNEETKRRITSVLNGDLKGTKHDAGKAPWHLMPWKAADQLVAVLGFGANKYGPENWRKVDNARDRYLSAAFRHLVAYARGEKVDPESKMPHLAHAMCSLAFMLEVDEENGAPNQGADRVSGSIEISGTDAELAGLPPCLLCHGRARIESTFDRFCNPEFTVAVRCSVCGSACNGADRDAAISFWRKRNTPIAGI